MCIMYVTRQKDYSQETKKLCVRDHRKSRDYPPKTKGLSTSDQETIYQRPNHVNLRNYRLSYVISGPFIADFAVWALLIVEGHMVIYSC